MLYVSSQALGATSRSSKLKNISSDYGFPRLRYWLLGIADSTWLNSRFVSAYLVIYAHRTLD